MEDKNILTRLEELEKLVARHDKQIAELVSKKAFTEMPEQVKNETDETVKNMYAEMQVVPSLEERIVAHLKTQGEIATVDSERVKSIVEPIRKDIDKKANAARKRIKERGLHF